jgi:hypothetical protein
VADLVTLQQVRDHLNLGSDTTHDTELQLYIDAVTEHVASKFGVLPSQSFTERLTPVDDGYGEHRWRFWPAHYPIISVTSAVAEDETEYTSGFTVSPGGASFRQDDITAFGEWTVTYVAGYGSIPADLKLAALEDIRGLYQPGQIGTSGPLGGFGIQPDVGPAFRPITQWPRVDAWIASRTLPAIA